MGTRSLSQSDVNRKELRDFGLIVGGILALIATFGLIRGAGRSYGFALTGALALMALGVFLPRVLTLSYRLWMALGFVLGLVMTHVVLTLTFFVAITVVGLMMRLARRDSMELRWPGKAATYWRARDKPRVDTYERPY